MDDNLGEHQRLTHIHNIELQHQSNLHQTELIGRAEEYRLLQLRVLTFGDEIALLRCQLSEKETHAKKINQKYDDLRAKLDLELAHNRPKEEKPASLKVEMESVKRLTHDPIEGVLEESMSVDGLNHLHSERQHPQSHLVNQQQLVADNFKLQQRLASLEAELEGARRAKANDRDMEVEAPTVDLQILPETAENKLVTVRKERHGLELDLKAKFAEMQCHNARLEERLSTLRLKFRDVQDVLRASQTALENCHCNAVKAARRIQGVQIAPNVQGPQNSKPREKDQDGVEIMDEPANMLLDIEGTFSKRPSNKQKLQHALQSEKSSFSITPFLNRTKIWADDSVEGSCLSSLSHLPSLLREPESSLPSDRENGFENRHTAAQPHPVSALSTSPRPNKQPNVVFLKEAPVSRKNKLISSKKRFSIPKALPLGGVAEEHSLDKQTTHSRLTTSRVRGHPQVDQSVVSRQISTNTTINVDAKKKKRKLLTGSHKLAFEGEDTNPTSYLPNEQLDSNRHLHRVAPCNGASFGTTKVFSPLKRDKRGVTASFLI